MKIAFTLDDVLRDKTKQILKIYKKYVDPSFDTEAVDLTTNNFQEILGFETKQDYQQFLYEDYVFEIFAEAEAVEKMLDKKFNLWLLSLAEEDEPVDVILTNPFEFNASIGFTHFFLSKMATRVRETYFPLDSSTIWDCCDVLVTAEPKLIKEKPEGKKVVKIETPYNKDLEADLTYQSLSELIEDKEIITKLTEQ